MKAAPRIFARGAALRAAPPPVRWFICGAGRPDAPARTATRPHLHTPSLVPPFLPHPRPHRAHGATPYDRPDAPLARLSPRHPSLVLPLTRRKVRPSHPLITPPQGSSVCTRHIHILRARRYARARRTHPAVPARSPHAPCPLVHPAPSSPVPAPRRTCARLHPPSLAPPPLIYRFSRAHRAYIVRTRSSPRRSSETAGL